MTKGNEQPSAENFFETNKKILYSKLPRVWEDFEVRFLDNVGIIPPLWRSRVRINETVLTEAINDAVMDVLRMQKHHLPANKQPDRHKWAAFVGKWVAKARPIYVIEEEGEETPALLTFLNDYFALWVFRSFLEYKVPSTMYCHLNYSFHFREIKGEILAMLAYSCEEVTRLAESSGAVIRDSGKSM